MRNIRKILDRYENEYSHRRDGKGAFYVSDLQQIREICRQGNKENYEMDLIFYGLYAGFIVGYDCRKREKKAADRKLPAERRRKLQELDRYIEHIPDSRLDALLCWAAQYSEQESI